MVQTAITQSIKTLNDAHAKFDLRRTETEQFFTEWFEDLSELTQQEQAALDPIRYRYRYHRADGPLAEDVFSLLPHRNQLYDVLQILKRVGQILSQG